MLKPSFRVEYSLSLIRMKFRWFICLKRYVSIYKSLLLKFVFNRHRWTWEGSKGRGLWYHPYFLCCIMARNGFYEASFHIKIGFLYIECNLSKNCLTIHTLAHLGSDGWGVAKRLLGVYFIKKDGIFKV